MDIKNVDDINEVARYESPTLDLIRKHFTEKSKNKFKKGKHIDFPFKVDEFCKDVDMMFHTVVSEYKKLEELQKKKSNLIILPGNR